MRITPDQVSLVLQGDRVTKQSKGIVNAKAALSRERDSLQVNIDTLSAKLNQVSKAILALEQLETPTRSISKRRPNERPTGTISDYVAAVRAVLYKSPKPTRDELRAAVGERISNMGKSRIALTARISQALKQLDRTLDY